MTDSVLRPVVSAVLSSIGGPLQSSGGIPSNAITEASTPIVESSANILETP